MTVDPLVGQQLDEYKLIRLLGRGGMARVYEATDVRLGRPVAIKVIDAPYRAETSYRERFMREAKAVAQLEHPNVVRLYRYGEAQELFYIAMQLVEGQDLLDRLARVKSSRSFLSMDEVYDIVHQVCQALDYVHRKGVIHRDIKPSNILLDEHGNVLLSDFGLAMTDATQTQGEVFGSPYYIAPEQAISSAGAVPQSDLYALGTILYEMVTGRRPFEADNALSIAMMHASDPPTPPRQLRPSISPALEDVILRAMAKEPRKRFGSGKELAQALRHALDQSPESAIASPFPNERKRPLPPVPAAVVAQSALKTADAPAPLAPPRRRRWGCMLWVILLAGLAAGGYWLYANNPEQLTQIQDQIAQVMATPETVRVEAPLPDDEPTEPAEPVAEPIETDVPTDVPTEVPTIASTETAVPTDVPATEQPTDEPEPTETTIVEVEPTQTETAVVEVEPTMTDLPTAVPTELPTATPIIEPVTVIITREVDAMPMVLVEGGTFMMGDENGAEDAQPVHEVTVSDFYIDQFEVSVGQYAAFLNEFVGFGQYGTGCFGALCMRSQFEGMDSYLTTNASGHTGQGESENRPVNHIRYLGAKAYCEQWAGGRLLTEAEWEYAARGVEGRPYAWGDETPNETRTVFGYGVIGETYQLFIQPVDAFEAGVTPLEVHGLTGGVAEWVEDLYDGTYYANSPAENPLNDTSNGRDYVVRGGAWNSTADELSASRRDFLNITEDSVSVGFRCAFDAQE